MIHTLNSLIWETNVLLSHVLRMFLYNLMHPSRGIFLECDVRECQYHRLVGGSILIYQIKFFFEKTWFGKCQILIIFPKILLFFTLKNIEKYNFPRNFSFRNFSFICRIVFCRICYMATI
jgi:hypothetical protein